MPTCVIIHEENFYKWLFMIAKLLNYIAPNILSGVAICNNSVIYHAGAITCAVACV